MGGPKALVELAGEPLARRALRTLAEGGCAPLVAVIGAAADRVAPLFPDGVQVVVAEDWAEGMGASLRAGLDALASTSADAVVVHLVDLPGVTGAAVARLVAGAGVGALRRAAYGGVAGHPVVLGREHWSAARSSAHGDAGARGYLAEHPQLELVECGDVASPGDLDTPEQLARFRQSG